MQIQISLSAARKPKYTPDEELLPLIFKWVHGSAKTRATVVAALMKASIRPEYRKGGTMYRQVMLPQRVAESALNPDAKQNDTVIELRESPLSSWTTNARFAQNFVSEKAGSTQSMIIVKRRISIDECLIYLPYFAKQSSLTDEDYAAVAKSKLKVFKLRMTTTSEAEAIVINNPSNLKILRKQIHFINHSTTKFTGLLRQIKRAHPDAETSKHSDYFKVGLTTSTRRLALEVSADGIRGTASKRNTGTTTYIGFTGTPALEQVSALIDWANSRSSKAPPFAVDKPVVSHRRVKPGVSRSPTALRMAKTKRPARPGGKRSAPMKLKLSRKAT